MQKARVKDRQRSETMKHKNPYLEGRMPPRHLETERLGDKAGSGAVYSDSIPHVEQAAVAEPAPTDV